MLSGGGIFSTLGTVKMRGGTTITGNRAEDSGGGICVQSPTGLEHFEVLRQLIPSCLTPKAEGTCLILRWVPAGLQDLIGYTLHPHALPITLRATPHIAGLHKFLNAQKHRPYELAGHLRRKQMVKGEGSRFYPPDRIGGNIY